MPPRPSFQRQRVATREAGSKLLIVCEGKATEYGYFEAARISLRFSRELVQVVHPDATDPKSLVLTARALMSGQDWKAGDQAWAVCDGDEHRHDEASRANWNDAMQLAAGSAAATSKRVNLAVSNPCFELWYLLHFQEQNAHLDRIAVKVALQRHLPDYEKPNILWEQLAPRRPTAYERAERRQQRILADDAEFCENPSTGVHALVQTLLAMKRE